ncbi:MAG TPA: Gfo/Idh/MocA family oxidoreductase [Rhodospirillales bacterium]|nr:Gfo/Idh/MocA family oxidoreductase [Rhodospirillales bacterium]
MINAAIVGLGWWGGTLVEAVQETSDKINFVAAHTRSKSKKDREIAARHGLQLADCFEDLLKDPKVDAIVLATPPMGHRDQVVAAAQAGKHVFCEKPFTATKAEAEAAVCAVEKAGVALGLGYNRRLHPSWVDLKRRMNAGELGTILHLECTMTFPNALTLPPEAWRAQKASAPCGGLFPLGVHAIDGMIDLVGTVDTVFAQSFHRAIPLDNDDTTSILFRMKEGMSGYLGVMTATAPTFRFQVYGSKAMAVLVGMTHVTGHSSKQRRTGLFASYTMLPIKGDPIEIEVPQYDVNRGVLEAFATEAAGGDRFPIPHGEMIHGSAVTEAIITSAQSGEVENIV